MNKLLSRIFEVLSCSVVYAFVIVLVITLIALIIVLSVCIIFAWGSI